LYLPRLLDQSVVFGHQLGQTLRNNGSGRRQEHGFIASDKEGDLQFPFHCRDLAAQDGLGYVDLFRGFREIQGFRRGKKTQNFGIGHIAFSN
jgi:hypothetical protein